MLSAQGKFKLPRGVVVNHFLNIKFPDKEVEKLSKSRGSAIWISDYLNSGMYADALRYYLTAISPETCRTVYQSDDLVKRYHSELGNVLGNLVSRTLTMAKKYLNATVCRPANDTCCEVDKSLIRAVADAYRETTSLMQDFHFKQAQERIMILARDCNKYLDSKAPWKTADKDLATTEITLFLCFAALRSTAIMLLPFIPETAAHILRLLGEDASNLVWMDAQNIPINDFHVEEAIILFPRL
ncbi:MAG: class I tRNA ligase family protein [Deltaproteobacteria bacterium]|nr:class I tRNA ligase family protein [Deltaproteobacteria bacterium]